MLRSRSMRELLSREQTELELHGCPLVQMTLLLCFEIRGTLPNLQPTLLEMKDKKFHEQISRYVKMGYQ